MNVSATRPAKPPAPASMLLGDDLAIDLWQYDSPRMIFFCTSSSLAL